MEILIMFNNGIFMLKFCHFFFWKFTTVQEEKEKAKELSQSWKKLYETINQTPFLQINTNNYFFQFPTLLFPLDNAKTI